jgi:replicative DNA helicase
VSITDDARPESRPQPLSSGGGGFDKSPPQDIAAEQSVLGGMLLSKDAIADVVEILKIHDFYRPVHATVFETILDLYGRGEPADGVTVAAALSDSGDLQRIGGVPYLHTLIESVPTAANASYYARIVSERAVLRRLVEAGTKIVQLGYGTGGNGGRDVDDIVDLAQQAVYDVTERRVSEDFAVLADMLQPTLDEIEAVGATGGMMTGVPTGFSDLDRLLNGLHPGQLIIVAGRPGLGKSTASMDFARNAAIRANCASAIFSLEMSKIEIVMRLLSAEARVPLHVLRSGQLSDDDWTKLARRMGEISEAPIFVDDTPSMNLMEIRAKARRLKQRHDLKLIVVDYLQLMTSPKRTESRQQEVADLSRGLKLLAKEVECPVIAVSQLNRGPEQRTDKRPQLSDLRESGCMPASTRLQRADNGAEITLAELLLTQIQPDVLAVDSRCRLVSSRLTKAFPSGIKPVFRLRLKSGREVDATANHRFLTIDGWRRLDEIEVGTAVAVPRILPPPARTADWDDDKLVLLAHLLGDGSIGPNSVKYATADLANKLAVEDAAKRAFGIEVSGKVLGRTWQLWLPSPTRLTHNKFHPVREWLEPLGLWGSRSGDKFIPEAIFGLPDDQLATFLRHLWATDGSITISRNAHGPIVRTYYASTSRRLAENVQRALLRFEVRSRLMPTTKYGYGRCWNVIVQGAEDQIRFLTSVGCHGERGGRIPEALQLLGQLKPNPNVDLVPWAVSARVKDAIAKAGLSHREVAALLGERYSGSYLLGSESRQRRFSRGRLARIAEITTSQALADLASSHIYWDAVAALEPLGEMPVFDATVEGTHNFIANGVIAHNSIEQDADVVILLHRDDYYDKESPRAGEADFIVAKHRNGPTDTVTVAAQLHLSRFVDMAIV